MPGRKFDPRQEQGFFVGLCFVSSMRSVMTLPQRVMAQVQGGANTTRAMGRAYNGHTALMCGQGGRVTRLVGWDPESSVEAFVKSTVFGYGGMGPITGTWGDDVGMDADPSAVFYGLTVSQPQFEKFRQFMAALIGRHDLGEALAQAGVRLHYAFKPNDVQNQATGQDIVANCGDAAFHVLASFLYEWGKKDYVDEMRGYILQNNLSLNFSQGMLMRWAG
jgi:hypothetical protein